MQLIIKKNYEEIGKWTADYIAAKINAFNPTAEKPFVIGLPTGSSPIGTYQELIKSIRQAKFRSKMWLLTWMSMWDFPKIIRKVTTRSCTTTFSGTLTFAPKT